MRLLRFDLLCMLPRTRHFSRAYRGEAARAALRRDRARAGAPRGARAARQRHRQRSRPGRQHGGWVASQQSPVAQSLLGACHPNVWQMAPKGPLPWLGFMPDQDDHFDHYRTNVAVCQPTSQRTHSLKLPHLVAPQCRWWCAACQRSCAASSCSGRATTTAAATRRYCRRSWTRYACLNRLISAPVCLAFIWPPHDGKLSRDSPGTAGLLYVTQRRTSTKVPILATWVR